MFGHHVWRFGRLLILIAVVAIGTAGWASALSPTGPSVATASAVADSNDNDEDDDNDNKDQNELEGQVLPVQCPLARGSRADVDVVCAGLPEGFVIPAINRSSNPPDAYVHNLDGAVRVTFTDRSLLDQFSEGNYVRLSGTRLDTFLFAADAIE